MLSAKIYNNKIREIRYKINEYPSIEKIMYDKFSYTKKMIKKMNFF